MDILEFVVGILDAAAWPLTIIILVLTFRKPIEKLLSRVKRAAVRDAEVTFDTEVGELRHDADALEDGGNSSGQRAGTPASEYDDKQTGFEQYKSVRLFRLAYELVEEYPMVGVALGRSAFESALAEAIHDTCDARLGKSLGRTISDLEPKLGRDWTDVARRTVKLGNAAAHGEVEDISLNAAKEFLEVTEELSGFAEMALKSKN